MLGHLNIIEGPEGAGPGGGPGDVPLHIQDAVGLPIHHVDQQLRLGKVHPAFLVNMELGRDSKVSSVGEESPPEHAPRCARVARDSQASIWTPSVHPNLECIRHLQSPGASMVIQAGFPQRRLPKQHVEGYLPLKATSKEDGYLHVIRVDDGTRDVGEQADELLLELPDLVRDLIDDDFDPLVIPQDVNPHNGRVVVAHQVRGHDVHHKVAGVIGREEVEGSQDAIKSSWGLDGHTPEISDPSLGDIFGHRDISAQGRMLPQQAGHPPMLKMLATSSESLECCLM